MVKKAYQHAQLINTHSISPRAIAILAVHFTYNFCLCLAVYVEIYMCKSLVVITAPI